MFGRIVHVPNQRHVSMIDFTRRINSCLAYKQVGSTPSSKRTLLSTSSSQRLDTSLNSDYGPPPTTSRYLLTYAPFLQLSPDETAEMPKVQLANPLKASLPQECLEKDALVILGGWEWANAAQLVGSVPTPDPNTSAKVPRYKWEPHRSWYKLVVYILLSAKRAAYFCKNIATQMGGVSRYFS